MHEWERIRSLPSEENLEKSLRTKIGVFLGEKQRSIEREIDGNKNRIAQRPYIGKPVNLDRCRYREVSRDLSRRCRENARRQLRCWGGIEEQHIRIKNKSSIDLPGVEKLSRIQTQSRSIHQVSRSYRAYKLNLDRSTRYRGAGEIAIRKSLGSSIDR